MSDPHELETILMHAKLNITNPLRNPRKQKHTVVSFFCGCGGMDLGFIGGFSYKDERIHHSSFEMLCAYDNNEKCVQTYRKNISNHALVRDLSELVPENIPSAEVLIGGFPCQDFATCGPRHGIESSRGRLYLSLIRYMDYHKPKVVIGENVPGLANLQKGLILEVIKADLESAGYKVEIWTLFAPDYGIPQRRTRLFIVAVRDDLAGNPEIPSAKFKKSEYLTTKWAIEDLERVTDESVSNQSQYFKASRSKKGNGQGDEISPSDAPSYTIRANAKSRVQFHYSLQRRLTVRECARIQTFPDDFVFPHSATTNIMQIGNAVPPLLAHIVADSVDQYMESVK